MTSKSDLRKIIINKRNSNLDEQNDAAKLHILAELDKNPTFIEARFIGLYYPLSVEIDLREIIEKYPNKKYAFPKIVDDKMIYIEYTKDTVFECSNFNVYEPVGRVDVSNQLDLVIVPALAMNKRNFRLGFGKGYFDKFFKKCPNPYKIGIIYKDEEIDFKEEDHDVALDCYLMG
ncbi:5-formyltetrahydrofolate cyclo-ligase [Acholeplasma hippikon]|uniref:5-formyltetrahydrofolate cyclo-ligase n=1 Tax=Acholeplasma hippikon TaxID=264636 RepID=A0A449BKV2_9MOLU|nr:5-formyltetrahydrofolate cyclo-ligase [Acholeplasma hippikon]VEU83079.1 5-formyltetrahydrofolate cyclo-ligase [Acholeplasma hippikon]